MRSTEQVDWAGDCRLDTYRFADHKEPVMDLLRRVTRVSVETVGIVEAMRAAPRDGA